MTFAYADPPYPGQSRRHYRNEPTYAGEVDHQVLIDRLSTEYPDGWALSTSSTALSHVLSLCPGDVRVMAWVKPFCSFKPNVNPAYAWEPVIVRGGRKRGRSKPTVRDWISANITLRRGIAGAKPEEFCWWLFEVLGAERGDTLVDLYPGTGVMTRVWEAYQATIRMALA
jgi:hypothetical protein